MKTVLRVLIGLTKIISSRDDTACKNEIYGIGAKFNNSIDYINYDYDLKVISF